MQKKGNPGTWPTSQKECNKLLRTSESIKDVPMDGERKERIGERWLYHGMHYCGRVKWARSLASWTSSPCFSWLGGRIEQKKIPPIVPIVRKSAKEEEKKNVFMYVWIGTTTITAAAPCFTLLASLDIRQFKNSIYRHTLNLFASELTQLFVDPKNDKYFYFFEREKMNKSEIWRHFSGRLLF